MSGSNPLNGTWYSSVGSKLDLEVNGSELKGKFHSTQDPSGSVPVLGAVATSVDPNPAFLPVAFSAAWPAGKDYGPSVTSYTGQYTNENDQEQIEVIFLLANQVESTVLWKSTSIASEIFKRTHP
jgi:hypothetical protein